MGDMLGISTQTWRKVESEVSSWKSKWDDALDGFYNVETFLAEREPEPGVLQVLVKWRGFDQSEATWEPIEECNDCQHLLDELRAREPRTQQHAGNESVKEAGGASPMKEQAHQGQGHAIVSRLIQQNEATVAARRRRGEKSSQYHGVSYEANNRSFRARLLHNSKRIRSECCYEEEQAARAYDALARKHRGAEAHGGRNGKYLLNFPTSTEEAAAERMCEAEESESEDDGEEAAEEDRYDRDTQDQDMGSAEDEAVQPQEEQEEDGTMKQKHLDVELAPLMQNNAETVAERLSRGETPSIYLGVSWHAENRHFCARFSEDEGVIGYYLDEQEAARAYDAVARAKLGAQAHGGDCGRNMLNFPTEEEVLTRQSISDGSPDSDFDRSNTKTVVADVHDDVAGAVDSEDEKPTSKGIVSDVANTEVALECCPFCEEVGGKNSTCGNGQKSGGGSGTAKNGRTRQRRAITRERKCPKMGKWWRNVGYTGPQYCQRCSEVFRDHIMRQHRNSAQCSRDNPCGDCASVLEHFDLAGDRAALWQRFDDRAKKNEIRRASRAPRTTGATVAVAPTLRPDNPPSHPDFIAGGAAPPGGISGTYHALLLPNHHHPPPPSQRVDAHAVGGAASIKRERPGSSDALLAHDMLFAEPSSKRHSSFGPKQAMLSLGLLGVVCVLALVGRALYVTDDQRPAAKDRGEKWICPVASKDGGNASSEPGAGNDHLSGGGDINSFCLAHPSAVYPCSFACEGGFGVGRTCRCDGCYFGGSCMTWQFDGVPDDEAASVSSTCRSVDDDNLDAGHHSRGLPQSWPQPWVMPEPYHSNIIARHTGNNVALVSDGGRTNGNDVVWLYQFQCLGDGPLFADEFSDGAMAPGSTDSIHMAPGSSRGSTDDIHIAPGSTDSSCGGSGANMQRGMWRYEAGTDTWTPYPLSVSPPPDADPPAEFGRFPSGEIIPSEPGARVGALSWIDGITGDIFIHGGTGCVENLDQPGFPDMNQASPITVSRDLVCDMPAQLSDLWRFRPADRIWTNLARQSDASSVWPKSWPRGRQGRTLWNTGVGADGLARVWTFGGGDDSKYSPWPVDGLWSYAYDPKAKSALSDEVWNTLYGEKAEQYGHEALLEQAPGLIGRWTLMTGHDYDYVTKAWLQGVAKGTAGVVGDNLEGDMLIYAAGGGAAKMARAQKDNPAAAEAALQLLDLEQILDQTGMDIAAKLDACNGAIWPLVSFHDARCPAPRIDAASWGDSKGHGWLYGGWTGAVYPGYNRMVNGSMTPGTEPLHWERQIVHGSDSIAMLNDLWRFNSGSVGGAGGQEHNTWVRIARPLDQRSPAFAQWPVAAAAASSFTTGCRQNADGSGGGSSCRLWLAFSAIGNNALYQHKMKLHGPLSTQTIHSLAAGLGLWAFDIESELWQQINASSTVATQPTSTTATAAGNPTKHAPEHVHWPGGRVGPLVADGGWLFGGEGPGECAVGIGASTAAEAQRERQELVDHYAPVVEKRGIYSSFALPFSRQKTPLAQLDGLWRIRPE